MKHTFSSFQPRKVGFGLLDGDNLHGRHPIQFLICNTGGIVGLVRQDSVRIIVDIPASLYRKLKARATANRRPVRELVLAGIKSVLLNGQRPRSKRLQFPLIVSDGPKVKLTKERIYEHVEFP